MPTPGTSYAFGSGNSPATMLPGAMRASPPDPARRSEVRNELRHLWATSTDRRLLVVLEAVNAGGKDGLIQELIELLGDRRVRVERFRAPPPGQDHRDVLDAAAQLVPEYGELVFFNRSYYGAVVHAARQGIDVTDECSRVVRFERRLGMGDVRLVKLFLHIDKREQLRRLRDRRCRPELRHLHNPVDFGDQREWQGIMLAYDAVLSATHTTSNPWLVIPSNDREVRNGAVEGVLIEVLR